MSNRMIKKKGEEEMDKEEEGEEEYSQKECNFNK